MRPFRVLAAVVAAGLATSLAALAPPATTVADFYLPGSQPGDVRRSEAPERCERCHGGYDSAVEPGLNWRGSMMAHAARDPLFNAALEVAEQDLPGVSELCLRCHAPSAWLDGALTTAGTRHREGVGCDLCHRLVPFAADADAGDGAGTAGDDCWKREQRPPERWGEPPVSPGSGMFVVADDRAQRGPFVNAAGRHHEVLDSDFHRQSALCGSCHDASNPAVSRLPDGSYALNTPGASADLDNGSFDPHLMFPLDRTYSEWRMSAFAAGGVDMAGRFGGAKRVVSTCQDCHMQDVAGKGASDSGAPWRGDLPLHDFTGANTFAPRTLASLWPREADAGALEAAVARARDMLRRAAGLRIVAERGGRLRVRVVNEAGHKLPGGPAGRRMWLNVRFQDRRGTVLSESGVYDPASASLLPDPQLKVYEAVQGISGQEGAPDGPGFHHALNNAVLSDNRIPPRGFANDGFSEVQAGPVGYAYKDGQHWDDTDFEVPEGTVYAEVRLLYQTVTREQIEFLRDEGPAGSWGERLHGAWEAAGRSAPELMARASWGTPPPDPAPPDVPRGLRATAASRSQIVLSWEPAGDNLMVVGYHVNRNSMAIATTEITSYVDGGLRPATTHCYSVRAFDAAGNLSVRSQTVCATTPRR